MKDLEAAIDAILDEMPDWFIIKKFLLLNKTEVKSMFFTEYDQEKVLEQTVNYERKRTATDMLMDNYPLSSIAKISKLSEDVILGLANRLG